MPFDRGRISALLFDVDGTLSDTDDMYVSRVEKMLLPFKPFVRDGNLQPLARRLVMGLETPSNFFYGLLDTLHLDDDVIRFLDRQAQKKAKPSHPFWIIPGVIEALQCLAVHYPMAVVSARDERSTLAFLDQFELRPLFKVVATSQTCLYTKPYPDPLVWAAQQLGVSAAECVMIGDTTVDIRAGKSAGAQTIGVLCGLGEEPELRRLGADLILPSTADIVPYLVDQSLGR